MPVVHPEQTARPAHPPLPPALVEIDDLRYSYPDGQPALLGVSLRTVSYTHLDVYKRQV